MPKNNFYEIFNVVVVDYPDFFFSVYFFYME